MVTAMTGVKTKTLLVPSKNRKKFSVSSRMVSMVMPNVTVIVATLELIVNSFVVALISLLTAFVGDVT